MRKLLFYFNLVLIMCFISNFGRTQSKFKHYFILKSNVYRNLYNDGRQNLNPQFANKFNNGFSYRIECKKIGLELGNQRLFPNYTARIEPNGTFPEKGTLVTELLYNWHLALTYNIVDNKIFAVTPFLGIARNWYRNWRYHSYVIGTPYSLIPTFKEESYMQYGAVAGIQFNVYVYKGFFINNAVSAFLYAQNRSNNFNLTYDVGIGYRLKRNGFKKNN